MSDTIDAADYAKAAKKPSKFKNQKDERDGITFHSKMEARRYDQLKLMERQGLIVHLVLQPRYPIVVNGVKVCTYVGDFLYLDCDAGEHVVEDVKGAITEGFRIKSKLMLAVHGITVRLVKA